MISPHFSGKEARDAVKWMFGFTNAQAKAYLDFSKASTIEEIVKAYKAQSKMSFEND